MLTGGYFRTPRDLLNALKPQLILRHCPVWMVVPEWENLDLSGTVPRADCRCFSENELHYNMRMSFYMRFSRDLEGDAKISDELNGLLSIWACAWSKAGSQPFAVVWRKSL